MLGPEAVWCLMAHAHLGSLQVLPGMASIPASFLTERIRECSAGAEFEMSSKPTALLHDIGSGTFSGVSASHAAGRRIMGIGEWPCGQRAYP